MPLLDARNSPRDIPRTAIFKPRNVDISLFKGGVGSPTDMLFTTRLTEVQSVKVRFEGSAGVARGALSAVVQMWYLGPVVVEISGRSYTGPFDDPAYNQYLRDSDIDTLIQLNNAINDTFLTTAEVSNYYVSLEYGNNNKTTTTSNALGGDFHTFYGAIDYITLDEGDTAAYFRPYTLKFTGELDTSFFVPVGVRNGQSDAKIWPTPKSVVASIVNTFGKSLHLPFKP